MISDSNDPEHTLERLSENDRMLDRRITILETRFDTILPTLATKADLAELKAELKAEIRAEGARTAKWMATIAVAMFVGFGGMFFTMLSLLPH